MPDQVMSKGARLIEAIAKHSGPIRSDELERSTGIERKNHSGLLATAVSKGLVIRAEVLNGNRACSEWRIGAAYTKGAVARMENAPPIEHIEPSERSLLREGGSDAQPAVARNTGRSAQVNSFASANPPGADQPEQPKPAIVYKADNAGTIQELANALDTITEQKQTIANLRIECDNLESRLNDPQPIDPRLMIAALQARMPEGISLHIHHNRISLINSMWKEVRIEPHEFFKFLDALTMLEERMAA